MSKRTTIFSDGSGRSGDWLEPVCGMTWGHPGVRGTWTTPAAVESIAALSKLNPNWVTIAYAAVQKTAQSTEIPFEDPPSLTTTRCAKPCAAPKTRG